MIITHLQCVLITQAPSVLAALFILGAIRTFQHQAAERSAIVQMLNDLPQAVKGRFLPKG